MLIIRIYFLFFLLSFYVCPASTTLRSVRGGVSTNKRTNEASSSSTHKHTHTHTREKKTTVIAIRYGKENKQEAKICSIDSLRICLFLASVSPATTMNHHSNKANLKFFTFFRFQTQLRFRFRLHRDGTAFLSIRRTSNISNHVALPQFLKQSF